MNLRNKTSATQQTEALEGSISHQASTPFGVELPGQWGSEAQAARGHSGSVTAVPEWLRLPRPRHRCPITGLSRSTLCELVVPSRANDYMPPVRSVLIKKKHAVRGVRLINLESLRQYLESLSKTSRTENPD